LHHGYLGGGVAGPNSPDRGGGELGPGSGAAEVPGTALGAIKGFGLHCAHAGTLGFGGSSGGTELGDGGRCFARARSLRSARLLTTLHPGRAVPGAAGSGGGAGSSSGLGGLHAGEYSPPAPCLDLTDINSAISYCRALLSSLSWPTSASNIRTSPARALLKSLRYFGAPL